MARKKFKHSIRFFYFDKMLGEFECPEQSNEIDRKIIAIKNNINKWTHFILGNNRVMGVKLKESKDDLRGERGEYSTADFLPLPTGNYLVWIEQDGKTKTIRLTISAEDILRIHRETGVSVYKMHHLI